MPDRFFDLTLQIYVYLDNATPFLEFFFFKGKYFFRRTTIL